jgi:hypothetical protein
LATSLSAAPLGLLGQAYQPDRGPVKELLREPFGQRGMNCRSSSTFTFSPTATLPMPSGMLKSMPNSLRRISVVA